MGGLTEDGKYVDGSLWYYAPNNAAPIVFANFFFSSGLYHLYQCYKFKSWRITGILPWSATLFIAGYVLRAYGAYHYSNLPIFIAQLVFLYAAPPIYELSNYFVLSRLLHYLPHYSPIHPGRILVTFIGLSTIIEVLTANGAVKAANSASTPTDIRVGKALLKTTLILQLAVLSLFVTIAASFHRSAARANALSRSEAGQRVRAVLITLYISSAFIGIRTIYRTVEYFAVASLHVTEDTRDSDISPLIRYEWFYWVFEAIPMVLNTWLLNARHPGRYLPRLITTYVGADGVEREGLGMKDHRGVVAKIVDPFDLKGLVLRRDQKWWEEGHTPEGEERDAERATAGSGAAKVEGKSEATAETATAGWTPKPRPRIYGPVQWLYYTIRDAREAKKAGQK